MRWKLGRDSSRETAFKRYEKYWRSVLDRLDDRIIVIDRDFRITYANKVVLRQYKLTEEKAVGQYCYQMFHNLSQPCNAPHWECPARETWSNRKPASVTHVYRFGRADKHERYIRVKTSPLPDGGSDIDEMVMIIQDVTEARRAEKRAAEANRSLLALNVIADAVSQSLDLDEILNSAFDKVLELMKGNTGGILLLDEETQTLSYRVYRGLSSEYVDGVAGLRIGEGIAGIAAEQGQPIYVDDISKDSRLTRLAVIKEGLRAFASVPLISRNKVMGVMNIASHSLRTFTPEDVQLMSNVSNQIAVAIENARLYEELRSREEKRGDLLHLVISTQEEERRRIARELHDGTSQNLTSLAVKLEAVAGTLSPDADEIRSRLKNIQSIVIRTLDDIHSVVYELRPSLLDDLGLIPALKWHVEDYLETAGVRAHLETAGAERRLPVDVEVALFRIVQEATTNIVKHSGAESASLSLEFGTDSVTVSIEDDGKGFDISEVDRVRDGVRGLGLLSMKERAEHLGGNLSVSSRPARGTRIELEIPVG